MSGRKVLPSFLLSTPAPCLARVLLLLLFSLAQISKQERREVKSGAAHIYTKAKAPVIVTSIASPLRRQSHVSPANRASTKRRESEDHSRFQIAF
jgi:hypothetical protein